MTIATYIPSLGRHTPEEIGRGPLVDLPVFRMTDRGHTFTYVVSEQEYPAYCAALGDAAEVYVLVCPEKGIAATRRWIGEHAASSGHAKFMMLDDDIRFLVRRSPQTWQLTGITPADGEELYTHIDALLDDYGHVGVSAREGNNRIGDGEPPLIAVNTRTLRALAYRTQDFLSVKHGRVQVMEDFDVNLQLLERGIPNACIHYWAQGQKMTNAPGGCSTYRSHEVHEESAHRLAELHPGLVSLRTKENKTDRDGFGTRTEVTIQWKRAYSG